MSVIHYAVEIYTPTNTTNSEYGFYLGVARFITDRPSYDLSTVIPTYGPTEIDIDGNTVTGNVPYAFYEGLVVKDGVTTNPGKSIDITMGGSYSNDCQFSFKIRNDIDFKSFCSSSSINLSNCITNFWVVIDDVFYQLARGRLTENQSTESELEFIVQDESTFIHKNIPPTLSVLPQNTSTSSNVSPIIQTGDPIPVIFGNVPYSKLLKNNNPNYVYPMNPTSAGALDYKPAAALAGSYNETTFTLSLIANQNVDIGIATTINNGGAYLSVVGGQYGGSNPPFDRFYRIVSATFLSYPTYVQFDLVLDSPLFNKSGNDSSEDEIMKQSDFNNISNGYALDPATRKSHQPYITWWFIISFFEESSYVSNLPVSVQNIYSYNSSNSTYNDISSLVKINALGTASLPSPSVELTSNVALNDGNVTKYDYIPTNIVGFGMDTNETTVQGTGNPSEWYTDSTSISTVTNRNRTDHKPMTTVLTPGIQTFLAVDIIPPPSVPAYNNPFLNNSYKSLYLCIDFDLSANTSSVILFSPRLVYYDLAGGNIVAGAPGAPPYIAYAPDNAYYYINSSGLNVHANFTPNDLMLNYASGDSSCLFSTQATTGYLTYRHIIKIQDSNPSVFTFMPVTRVRLYSILYNDTAGYPITINIKNIAIVGERELDTITGDIFSRTTGEKTGSTTGPVLAGPTYPDGNNFVGDVYHAFMHMLEDYDGIPTKLINYDLLQQNRANGTYPAQTWYVSRTLTEQKNSINYLNELCAQTFVGMFSGRSGKREFRVFQGFLGGLSPNTGPGKSINHNSSLIIRDSIQGIQTTSINNVFNSFNIQYYYDAGSKNYIRSFNISNVDKSTFPIISAVNSSDASKPLWWSYFNGLPVSIEDPFNTSLQITPVTGSNLLASDVYNKSKVLWDACRAAYLQNGIVQVASGDLSTLGWFNDSQLWSASDWSSTDITSTAYLFLVLAVAYCTKQKDIISYSIPINSSTYGTELLDIVNVNDPVYTRGQNRIGWVVSIEADVSNDKFNLKIMFPPV